MLFSFGRFWGRVLPLQTIACSTILGGQLKETWKELVLWDFGFSHILCFSAVEWHTLNPRTSEMFKTCFDGENIDCAIDKTFLRM